MRQNACKLIENNSDEEMVTEMMSKAKKVRSLSHKGSILVMDDEFTIRNFMFHMLKVSGYRVFLTRNGDEAVEYYTKAKKCGYPFDAAILDVNIPNGMGGKDAVKKLRDVDPEVKAIVMSGDSTDPALLNYKAYGFIEALPKPFTLGELTHVLHRAITSVKNVFRSAEHKVAFSR